MAQKRLLKELKSTTSLPNTVLLLQPINGDLFTWTAIIQPIDSLYSNAHFQLIMQIPQSYPLEPPTVRFITHLSPTKDKSLLSKDVKISTYIPHCNIDFKTGEICLDILKKDHWSPAWTLQTVILAIVVLLDNQEPDSPLNVDMANLFRTDDAAAIKSLINYYISR